MFTIILSKFLKFFYNVIEYFFEELKSEQVSDEVSDEETDEVSDEETDEVSDEETDEVSDEVLDEELDEETEENLNPTKIRLVSIEGNIGAGKTTLINNLKSKYEDRDDILFLEEPIDIWNTIQDENGKNILQNFYKNLGKYAFMFQVMAYTTRLQLIKNTIKNAPRTVKIIVMERSLEADANIFAKMLYEEGIMNKMEYQIYSLMIQDNWNDYGVDGIIWLRTDARECYSRTRNRNREGEDNIDLSYLRKCEQYHLEWLSADLGFVCDISDNNTTEEDYLEKINNYLDL